MVAEAEAPACIPGLQRLRLMKSVSQQILNDNSPRSYELGDLLVSQRCGRDGHVMAAPSHGVAFVYAYAVLVAWMAAVVLEGQRAMMPTWISVPKERQLRQPGQDKEAVSSCYWQGRSKCISHTVQLQQQWRPCR